MTDIICPLCGKLNPPDLDECMYCQAPLKTGGFIVSSEGEASVDLPVDSSGSADAAQNIPAAPEPASNLEQTIPDWLKATEASFLEGTEAEKLKGETPASEPDEFTHDQLSEQIDSLINPPSTPSITPSPAIDDEWLASLLAEAGAGEPAQETSPEEPLLESLPEPSQESV